MFVFEEPFDVNDDWYLGEKHAEKIPNKILKSISNVHMVGIQYLFDNYVRKRSGAILNEDDELNMPLQVCAFLSSVKEKIDVTSPVLIVCSETSLCKWHYHASEVGFKPQIVTSENFDDVGVYILSSDSIKLAVNLLDRNLFCVVMDDFDAIATKVLVRKLRGSFNIGLTKRSFYKEPDQKLRWSMLNWVSPGCVGKLNDFYRIDRLHSLAFSDNYRYWWLRLTWKFCDSFEPPNDEDLKEYQQKLQEWAKLHHIPLCDKSNSTLKRSRGKKQSRRNIKKTKYDTKNLDGDDSINSSDSSFSIPSTPEEITVKTENKIEDTKEIRELPENKNLANTTVESKHFEVSKNIESDEDMYFDLTKNVHEDDPKKMSPTTSNHVETVKCEFSETTSIACEEEPILSIIYSQISNSCNVSKSSENDSKFLPVTQKADESETFRRISDVFDNLSDVEGDNEANSDDDSFFSELISGRKKDS